MSNKLYTEDSIESLSPLEFTRLRPGVYCGNTAYSTQLLVEIISNAVDEFRLGHGNQIDVNIGKDNIITVKDYGQGFIPNSYREDGKSILEAATIAQDYVVESMKLTLGDDSHWYGVKFEKALPFLIKALQ